MPVETNGHEVGVRELLPSAGVRGLAAFVGSVAFGLFMAFIILPPMMEVVIPHPYGIGALQTTRRLL